MSVENAWNFPFLPFFYGNMWRKGRRENDIIYEWPLIMKWFLFNSIACYATTFAFVFAHFRKRSDVISFKIWISFNFREIYWFLEIFENGFIKRCIFHGGGFVGWGRDGSTCGERGGVTGSTGSSRRKFGKRGRSVGFDGVFEQWECPSGTGIFSGEEHRVDWELQRIFDCEFHL